MTWNLAKWRWRLLPGSLSAASIAILLNLNIFQPLEQAGYQTLFQLRGTQAWDSRLALIAIDDASLAQIGRFPWSRRYYADLLQTLAQANTSIVVFNLLFSEPSADDELLATAIRHQGRVVLAQARDAEGALLQPVPVLRQAALGTGHILTQQNSDGIARRVKSQIGGTSALSVVAVQAYSLMQQMIPLPKATQSVWLNWVGNAKSMRQYSFADVIQGKVSPQVFSNKIVLVGVTATGIDPLYTPFDRNPSTSSVLLHATLIQNLLQQTTLHPFAIGWMVLLFLIGGPLLGWSLTGRGWMKQTATMLGLEASWIIASLLLLKVNVLAPIVAPLALFFLTISATSLCDRWQETITLQQQLRQLQQNGVLQEEFLRTASHELRAPVANIQNIISLLRRAQSPEDWEEYLQILEEECLQESALINDLLDFQRISNNPQPIQLETYDLRDWLSEVLTPFVFRAEPIQQTIELQVDCDAPPLTLDWLSLRRILTELLNNACKYTPLGEVIQVRARVVPAQLELLVSNSGVTLPPEDLTKIFQPFYRNVDVDYRHQGGTGLGLAIIQRLTEHLGGEVQVANQQDVLTFMVRLPIKSVNSPQSSDFKKG